MFCKDNLENGMVLGNDDEPRLSQWDKEWENQDDERDNEWWLNWNEYQRIGEDD